MDRRVLELRVQELIDCGLNPCEDLELSVALRKHPELRQQAEELYRVDQMLRCAACAGEPGCECDALLNDVLEKVEKVPQDAQAKGGSWVFRMGLPAAAAATIHALAALTAAAAPPAAALPGPAFEPVDGPARLRSEPGAVLGLFGSPAGSNAAAGLSRYPAAPGLPSSAASPRLNGPARPSASPFRRIAPYVLPFVRSRFEPNGGRAAA
jgi:hypothetical protein